MALRVALVLLVAALVAALAILFVVLGFGALVGMMMTPTPPVFAPF